MVQKRVIGVQRGEAEISPKHHYVTRQSDAHEYCFYGALLKFRKRNVILLCL